MITLDYNEYITKKVRRKNKSINILDVRPFLRTSNMLTGEMIDNVAGKQRLIQLH